MTGPVDQFHHDVAAARAAASRGQRGEAEQWLRAALGHAEVEAVPDGAMATVLFELAALRRDEEDLAEAELLLQRALQVLDASAHPDDAVLLHTLSALGSVLAARGESSHAEALLTRALGIGERVLGDDHPELAGLLNDLSRLHLKAGAHAAAEPLLLRLYDLKCGAKGEDHPESATVLASLAGARQALGRHEDAEAMWRRVLTVREQTLAPNHFATATALEHLAEACAARGKLTEAVQLLRRAVTMREVTLGASHPSLRVTRDRIADLRLQASDGALEGFAPPERQLSPPIMALPGFSARVEPAVPTRATTPRVDPTPTPRVDPTPTPRLDPAPTPRLNQTPTPRAERSESVFSSRPAPADAPPAPSSLVLPMSGGSLGLHESAAARTAMAATPSVYEGLMSIQAELGVADEDDDEELDEAEREQDQRRAVFGAAALKQLATRRAQIIVAGVVTVGLLGGIVAMRSRGDVELYASENGAVQRTPAAVTLQSQNEPATASAATPIVATEAVHVASSVGSPEPHPPISTPRRVVNGEVASSARETPAPAAVAPPKLINLGAIAGAVQAPSVSVSESSRGPALSDAPKRKFDLGVADGSSEFVRARLVGAAPTPKFPEILRDRKITGDVLVRFTVDAQGRPDASSITIIRTPHELMSDAVRRVIPSLRFEPAHNGRIGAPNEPDQVQMAFQFNGATN